MNQEVVATFKAPYLGRVFRLLEAWSGGTHLQLAVLDFWRDYSFLDAVYNISESWEEFPPATLKLWPECVQHYDSGVHVETAPQIPRDIAALAPCASFREVTEADVADLLQSCGADLSNQELIALEQVPATRRGGG